jgi:hypothetical protein
VFTPSVGVKQFCVGLDEMMVDAYFRCRSNINGRSVHDLYFKKHD